MNVDGLWDSSDAWWHDPTQDDRNAAYLQVTLRKKSFEAQQLLFRY